MQQTRVKSTDSGNRGDAFHKAREAILKLGDLKVKVQGCQGGSMCSQWKEQQE